MRKFYVIFILLHLLFIADNQSFAQADTTKSFGVKVTAPGNENRNTTYFFISAGQQLPGWYHVPMIPEFPVNMELNGKMNVRVPGWFAGIGIMKKTKTKFEVGLLCDFYKTTIPIAFSGQRCVSEWDYVQRKAGTFYTEIRENDINRISEVYAIRASIRYKIPFGPFQFWGGIAPGTFSSKVYYSETGNSKPVGIINTTSLGISWQAGINLVLKNNKGKDMLRFGFYSDFSGPEIDDNIINLLNHGWIFKSPGNYAINPVRLGLLVGIH
jgi:hypothetical protein